MSDIVPDDLPTVPWFRNQTSPHPFIHKTHIPPNAQDRRPLFALAIFPWSATSLESLWGGQLLNDEWLAPWSAMISAWRGAVAVGGRGRLIVRTLMTTPSVGAIVSLPDNKNEEPSHIRTEPEVRAVGWALRKSAPCEPLVVFSVSSTVHILHVGSMRIVGSLRGHGRSITSIAVHPTFPYLFCTTSRDFTTRIYHLESTPKQTPNNPPWPPETLPSKAGAAHGLDMTASEGTGIGRCLAVLVGGRSGGHEGDVFAAAFHPEKDIIATCGMDRCVKIWRIPWLEVDVLKRADKPLFTTSLLHKSRVVSIAWTFNDMLISHCAPAWQRRHGDFSWEPGTIAHWRWLGYDRYFPANAPTHAVGRCISDYQESSSFKLTAVMALPIIKSSTIHITHSPHVHVFSTPSHDPLVLFSNPETGTIGLINVVDLPIPNPCVFPEDADLLSRMNEQLRLDDDDDAEVKRENDSAGTDDEGAERKGKAHGEMQETHRRVTRAPPIPPFHEPWTLAVCNPEKELVEASAMGADGMMIVSVGSKGSIWVHLAQQGRFFVNAKPEGNAG